MLKVSLFLNSFPVVLRSIHFILELLEIIMLYSYLLAQFSVVSGRYLLQVVLGS